MSNEISQLANKYTGERCFLVVDGKRHSAVVTGRNLSFAKITAVMTSSISVEFAWQTVDRIMQSTKTFQG